MAFIDRLRRIFGAADAPKPASTPQSRANDVVASLFEGHGMRTSRHENWITFGPGLPIIQAEVVSKKEAETTISMQFDVRAILPDGRRMTESFSGVGADEKTAAQDAFGSFARGAFHVIYKAFYDPSDEHQDVENWTFGEGPRVVVPGPALLRGVEDAGAVAECAQAFERTLREQSFDTRAHWIRLFVAQLKGEVIGGEVLIDNELSEDLTAQFLALPWPRATRYYSLRQFLIVQSESGADHV